LWGRPRGVHWPPRPTSRILFIDCWCQLVPTHQRDQHLHETKFSELQPQMSQNWSTDWPIEYFTINAMRVTRERLTSMSCAFCMSVVCSFSKSSSLLAWSLFTFSNFFNAAFSCKRIINQSINQSIDRKNNHSLIQSINWSINNQSIHQLNYQNTKLPINSQPINVSMNV